MKYIIGDTHGCYKTLVSLLNKLPKNIKTEDIIFVGDIIDRGNNSREILNLIRNNNYKCIRGNHEEMLIEAKKYLNQSNNNYNDINNNNWIYNGGYSTILNYIEEEILNKKEFIKDIEFLESLPIFFHFPEEKDENGKELIVTHACIVDLLDNMKDLKQINNKYKDLSLWNREFPSIGSKKYFNVSGHNIIENILQKAKKSNLFDKVENGIILNKDNGFAFIDTGSFLKHQGITCLRFPDMKVFFQKNIEE